MGITTRDIYASLSTEKNIETREAEKENPDDSLIIAALDFNNTRFHENISQNLGITFDKESPVFKGATFFADEAIRLKLAHQIGSLDDALNFVLKEGLKIKANNNY